MSMVDMEWLWFVYCIIFFIGVKVVFCMSFVFVLVIVDKIVGWFGMIEGFLINVFRLIFFFLLIFVLFFILIFFWKNDNWESFRVKREWDVNSRKFSVVLISIGGRIVRVIVIILVFCLRRDLMKVGDIVCLVDRVNCFRFN